MWTGKTRGESGSALLAVLWLSAALATIGFSLASTVRGETERTSTALDSLRCYYLAAGGVERAALELLWSVQNPAQRMLPDPTFQVIYRFASGDVRVEIIPEAAKLDVNTISPADLVRLGVAIGLEQDQARQIAAAIVSWRQSAGPDAASVLPMPDPSSPSFRLPHASIQEIEELLAVPGVTPEIFYGTYLPAEGSSEGGPRLVRYPGLVDCLSVFGSKDAVDINTANPAVLAALGQTPVSIAAILQRRSQGPIQDKDLGPFLASIGAPAIRLRVGGNSIVTMRATARLRLANGQLGDLKRTVAAQVKYMPPGWDPPPVHILRWYDTAWSD
jgi:general secretion pathway protein K